MQWTSKSAFLVIAGMLCFPEGIVAQEVQYRCCGPRERCQYGPGTQKGCETLTTNSCSVLKIDRQKCVVSVNYGGDWSVFNPPAEWGESTVVLYSTRGRNLNAWAQVNMKTLVLTTYNENNICFGGGCTATQMKSEQARSRTK